MQNDISLMLMNCLNFLPRLDFQEIIFSNLQYGSQLICEPAF